MRSSGYIAVIFICFSLNGFFVSEVAFAVFKL